MFSTNRNELRALFFTAWRKHLEKLPLEPLEAQILSVILVHPEYHLLLSDRDCYQDKDFIEFNPFLHMSLHLALEEQLNTDRPVGIQAVYKNLLQKFSDSHELKHKMIDCLAEILWKAQRDNRMPDELDYIRSLKQLAP